MQRRLPPDSRARRAPLELSLPRHLTARSRRNPLWILRRSRRRSDGILGGSIIFCLCCISLASIVDMYGPNGAQSTCCNGGLYAEVMLFAVHLHICVDDAGRRPCHVDELVKPSTACSKAPNLSVPPTLARRAVMARRPSTVSLSSVGSGSGLSKLTQLPPLPPLISRSSSKSLPNGSPTASRQVSINAQLELAKPGEVWDPDELFAKHTVAEVKVIQQRLQCVSCHFVPI